MRRLYILSEERRAEDFFALKIRRLPLGANPQTWVPKASTLPLDHRNRYRPTQLHIDGNFYKICIMMHGSMKVKLISDLLTYLLTYSMEQSPSWEANQETLQLVKNFPAFIESESPSPYSQVPATCPYPELTPSGSQQPPPPTSWRFILILSSHLLPGLRNSFFPSGFPTNTLCTPLSSPIRATCPAHLICLDFTTCTILG
jgi:hypothetical protein